MPDHRDLRSRARIRIELLARIRQIAPPRNLVEIVRTLDVSRNGLLFRTREPYDANTTIWITMPYVENALAQALEFPASVVRVLPQPDRISEIAVQFHSAHADRFRTSYREERPPSIAPGKAKKRRPRVKVTLPIRVRNEKVSEESVTVDVSRTGVLFRSQKDFDAGQPVMVSMPHQPQGRLEETLAVVVRTVERASVRCVALEFAAAKAGAENQWDSPPSYYAR